MSKIIQTFPTGGGDSSNETISKTDFDALTQEEKDNGTAYYIPDADIVTDFTVMGNRFDKANIYTADERMIGSYLGKPLYQRVCDFGSVMSFPKDTWTNTNVSKDGIDIVIKVVGLAPEGAMFNGINISWDDSTSAYLQLQNIRTNAVSFRYLIIQYTKTSDGIVSVGTGNDYSTDEQIIGTWIDGKPLYQKTVDCGALPNNTTKTIQTGLTDISIKYLFGYAYNSTITMAITLPFAGNSNGGIILRCIGSNIEIQSDMDRSAFSTSYVTIQYTKTTD